MIAPSALKGRIDPATFHADVASIESLWRRRPVGNVDLPVLDIGQGEPLVFVPILEHLEFVYARQIRAFSQDRRVILYRRQETRRSPGIGLAARAEELCRVLDTLHIASADFVGHGDGAMALLEFALRYPARCRSLTIIAQAADYRITPHPFIWLLHELYLRLPVESLVPAWLLRRSVVNYIVSQDSSKDAAPEISPTPWVLPRNLIDEQFRKIALWPRVYKFSVLPIIHSFDIRARLAQLTMPILLINRFDDALSPEAKTREFTARLPNCAGYYVIPGGERFFMYAEAEAVTQIMRTFLAGP